MQKISVHAHVEVEKNVILKRTVLLLMKRIVLKKDSFIIGEKRCPEK